ncbi:MAG: hypothetical protein LBT66_06785 [Methanobrevibacter sp.]|jgi:hypothetical protein|nr:hypothetical protein [Candidatus Methanovirga meridionalis]
MKYKEIVDVYEALSQPTKRLEDIQKNLVYERFVRLSEIFHEKYEIIIVKYEIIIVVKKWLLFMLLWRQFNWLKWVVETEYLRNKMVIK